MRYIEQKDPWWAIPHVAYTEQRYVGDLNGEPQYTPERDVMCRTWRSEMVYCDRCEAMLKEQYPQGWAYYAGDVCQHGVYTGGVGVDHMCHHCEMGYDLWVADPLYVLKYSVDPMAYPVKLAEWRESDIEEKWDTLVREWTKPDCIWVSPEALDYNPVFEVSQANAGYWE